MLLPLAVHSLVTSVPLPFDLRFEASELSGSEAAFLCGQRVSAEVFLRDDRIGRTALSPIDAFNELSVECDPKLRLVRVDASPGRVTKSYLLASGRCVSDWRADRLQPAVHIAYSFTNASSARIPVRVVLRTRSNVGYVNKFVQHDDDLAAVLPTGIRFSDAAHPDLAYSITAKPSPERVMLDPATLEWSNTIAPKGRWELRITVGDGGPTRDVDMLAGAARMETPLPELDEFLRACMSWPVSNVRLLPFGPPFGEDGTRNKLWPVITASPDYHGIFANDCIQSLWEIGLLGPAMYEASRNSVDTMFAYGPKESVEWWTGDGKVWCFPLPLGDTPQVVMGACWHLLWSGDKTLAARWWPEIQRFLAVLPANDSDGDWLEDRPNTPYPEQPDPGEYNHEMLYVQCFWQQAYAKAADVAEWLGKPEAPKLRDTAARIAKSIEERFSTPYGLGVWLNKKHEPHPHIGHEQIIAAAYGCVSDAKARQIVETMTKPPMWTPDGPLRAEPGKGVAAGDHVWTFMRWKLLQAMFRLGETDRAIALAETWAAQERGMLYQAPEGFPTVTGTTGKGYTWTACRALRAVVFGLSGLTLDGKGVRFSPSLPSGWRGFALRDLTVHGARVDLIVTRGKPGVRVDGKPASVAFLPYATLGTGRHKVEVRFAAEGQRAGGGVTSAR